MKNSYKAAILKILYDLVGSDGAIDDRELLKLMELKHKYGIVRKCSTECQIVENAHNITFSDALIILKKWIEENKDDSFVKMFSEDLFDLANVDGECSLNEARIILAVAYVLNDEAKIFSYKDRDMLFSKREMVYVENDFDESLNSEVSQRYYFLSSQLKLYGYDFVYIPSITKLFKKKYDMGLLSEVLLLNTPDVFSNEEQDIVLNTICNVTTEQFCSLSFRDKIDSPALLIKVKTSNVPISKENRIYYDTYSDFLMIYVEKDISSTILSFTEQLILKTKKLKVSVDIESLSVLSSKGFHKTIIDYAISKVKENYVTKIIFDFTQKRKVVLFKGVNAVCVMQPMEFILYLYIIMKSVDVRENGLISDCCDGEFYDKEFNKLYGKISENRVDLFSRLPVSVSKIKKSLSSIIKIKGYEGYIPCKEDGRYRVLINPSIVYIKTYGGEEFNLTEWRYQ